jgi:uncharacterized protein YjiS (DUF1127 family)
MSSFELSTKSSAHSSSPRSGIAGDVYREALLALVRRLFLNRANGPHWSELNAHLLADIGETRASAEAAVAHRIFGAPLGTLGFDRYSGSPERRRLCLRASTLD